MWTPIPMPNPKKFHLFHLLYCASCLSSLFLIYFFGTQNLTQGLGFTGHTFCSKLYLVQFWQVSEVLKKIICRKKEISYKISENQKSHYDRGMLVDLNQFKCICCLVQYLPLILLFYSFFSIFSVDEVHFWKSNFKGKF